MTPKIHATEMLRIGWDLAGELEKAEARCRQLEALNSEMLALLTRVYNEVDLGSTGLLTAVNKALVAAQERAGHVR